MAQDKRNYRVMIAGFFFGNFRKAGDSLALTERQAKYEVLQGNLKLESEVLAEQEKAAKAIETPKHAGPARKRRVGGAVGLPS